MKKFEKWFKKHKPYDTYSCMDMAKKAWEAALEMVKSEIFEHRDVLDVIEEELEE